MRTLNSSLIRSIAALVLGLLLIIWPDIAINYLVITVGILFFVTGLISLIGYFTRNKDKGKSTFPLEGAGSLLFGLWLIIMPAFFINILMYVLGFILILAGIQQIASLVSAKKWTKVSFGFYIVPILILIAGIVVIVNPFDVASAAFMVLGITSLIYGLAELITNFKFRKRLE